MLLRMLFIFALFMARQIFFLKRLKVLRYFVIEYHFRSPLTLMLTLQEIKLTS